MSNVLKNYASTLWMLAGIILGAIVGIWFTPAVPYLKPIGEIFMNLLFTIIVPLVFLSIVWAIYNLCAKQMVGKVLLNTLIVFLGMAVLLGTISYVACLIYNPLENFDTNWQLESTNRDIPFGELLVSNLTVNDFIKLFNKSSLLPLIIFAALFGYAIAALGEKGTSMARFIDQANQTIIKFIDIIIRFAPIGIGCYFADIISQLGGEIIGSYIRVIILYLVLTVLVYFVVYPVIVYLFRGSNGLRLFWQNVLPSSLMAISTCSSSACIPVNIEQTKKMGANTIIADSIVPLGTNLNKNGSLLCDVIKVIFAMVFLGMNIHSFSGAVIIIGIAFLASIVVGAVPSGAITSEMLICSMLGCTDPTMVAILVVIANIIDIPATLLNATGNVVSPLVISKVTMNE